MAPVRTGASTVEMTGATYGGPAITVPSPSRQSRLAGYIIRLLVVVLTFIATIVMGVAKQSFSQFQITVKSTQNSSFVYFIVANVLVFVYSAVAVGLSFINPSSTGLELILGIVDLLALGFLFTSNAAAMAVDVIARKGNTHYDWDKFCNIADKLCSHITAAIVLSSLATVVYVILFVFFIIALHRRAG